MNRLNLNFQLEFARDRANFVDAYLKQDEFKKKPLTQKELQTISDYILWGKEDNGEKIEVQIDRKNSTWAEKPLESIEGLKELEGFQEASLKPLNSTPPTKLPKVKFERSQVKDSYLEDEFQFLFDEIDELDIIITFYDLAHNKRKAKPRESLISKFSDEELQKFRERASNLTEKKYLALKHQLVELRREQYTLKDFLKPAIYRHSNHPQLIFDESPILETRPLGLFTKRKLQTLIFSEAPNPNLLDEELQKELSTLIWETAKKEDAPSFLEPLFWNFLLDNYRLIEDAANEAIEDHYFLSQLPDLKRTIDFYVRAANLTDAQLRILQLKIKGIRNEDIAREVNRTFNKSYSINYISTIYRKRIINNICAAVAHHYEVVQELFFPENFKTCKECGKVLLKDPVNFVRKQRSADGFSNFCKECEKKRKGIKK